MSPEEMINNIKQANNNRVKNFNQRQKDKGLVNVSVWILREHKDLLIEFASELRGKTL